MKQDNQSVLNQYKLYKTKVCMCEDESNWETWYTTGVNVPKDQHYQDQVLECSRCNVVIANHTIIFHTGYCEFCDVCNYKAYGEEPPLWFALEYVTCQLTIRRNN